MMMDDSNYTESNQSIQQELQNPPAAGSLLATDAGATPVKHKRKGWAKQNCYYWTHVLLFLGAVLCNIATLTLFVEDATHYNNGNWTECFLYLEQKSCAGNGLFCNIVVGAESIAALISLAMFVIYIVWMVKGAKIVSRFRVIDLTVVFALGLLSCAIGIILISGIEATQNTQLYCEKNIKMCSQCIKFPTSKYFTSNSKGVQAQYASFALAAFYFLIFVLGMIPIVIRFICCNKVGHATNDEATPILSGASRRRTLS